MPLRPVVADSFLLSRRVGGAFVDDTCYAVAQRAVHDVAVPGNPRGVSCAPIDIGLWFDVEDVLVGEGDLGEKPAGRMHDPLGLGRGARRIEQEQKLFGVHGFGWAIERGVSHQLVPPQIAPFGHLHIGAASVEHHDVLNRWRSFGECLVDIWFQGERHAAAIPGVCGDNHFAVSVFATISDRFRAEPAKDHGVCNADPSTGEHRDWRFENHRHVDGSAIALL